MGCFVHVILLGVGCFVSLQKNMWWFLSTYNKMDVGGFVLGIVTCTSKLAELVMGIYILCSTSCYLGSYAMSQFQFNHYFLYNFHVIHNLETVHVTTA